MNDDQQAVADNLITDAGGVAATMGSPKQAFQSLSVEQVTRPSSRTKTVGGFTI